jgi:integrase
VTSPITDLCFRWRWRPYQAKLLDATTAREVQLFNEESLRRRSLLSEVQWTQVRALDEKEVLVLIEEVRSSRWGALWELLVFTGMRPSEALGLKWSDVDWGSGRIFVQRSLYRRSATDWIFKEPKTARGRRNVLLLDSMLDSLKQHRARQAEERLRMGGLYADRGVVFANRKGEPLNYTVTVRRHFKPVVRALGFDTLTPYGLRHTCASIIMKAGTPPHVVSETLGHANVKITLDTYSHVLPGMQETARDAMQKIFFGDRTRSNRTLSLDSERDTR